MRLRTQEREPVPVDVTAEELVPELARQRAVANAYRTDVLERERAEAQHERNRADLAAELRQAERERDEAEEQACADADLARVYREAHAAGERTRITSQMARSGEVRALRLERLRALNLRILVPVLLGFAGWSTTGVHHGALRLMGIDLGALGDPMWWALWLLEPALIGAVVWILITHARLASAGGELDPRAEALAIGCLGTSILLNFSAAIPDKTPHGWLGALTVIGGMVAHAVGPTGAAATAHLIGVVDDSIAKADPWHEGADKQPVPLLTEMDFGARVSGPAGDLRRSALQDTETVTTPATEWPLPLAGRMPLPIISAVESTPESAVESACVEWPLPLGERVLLPIVTASESTPESAAGNAPESASEAVTAAPIAWPQLLNGSTPLPMVTASQSALPSASGSTRRTTEDQDGQQVSRAPRKARTERPNKGKPVPPSALKSAEERTSRALSDEELSERLRDLVKAGELPADASYRSIQNALGIGFGRAKRVFSIHDSGDAEEHSVPALKVLAN